MPKKSKTIRVYDYKSYLGFAPRSQSLAYVAIPQPAGCSCGVYYVNSYVAIVVLPCLSCSSQANTGSTGLRISVRYPDSRLHFLSRYSSVKADFVCPSANPLSSLQKVIHRETEKLPKERNELIDSSSYRPNDFPSIDSGSESGMTLSVSQGNNEVFCHPERSEGSQKHSLSRRNKGNHRGWLRSNGPADVCDPISRACEGERGRGEGAKLQTNEADALPKNETNLFTCLEFAPRSQRFAYGASAPAGSLCSLSGFAHFVRAIRPQIRYSLITLFTSTKAAFTLAEVLITLAIIGVVAALTIPGLIENHNQKALDTAKTVFIRRLQEATKQMNVDGKMQGYSTTEDFVKTFRNYMKNMQVCEKGKTEKCFAAQIKIPSGEKIEEFDTSELQTSKNFKKDYNTNIMGYSLPNGASMLLAYDPDCSYIDPFDSNADTTKCISMVYDVNGKKKPNEQGKDIFTLNGVQLSVPCKKKHEALNMTLACEDIEPEPLNTCIGSGNEIYDDRGNHRYCEYNRWAGAKKACEVQGMRLPSLQELADIATYLYDQDDDPIGPYEYRKASLNYEKLNELNFGTVDFYVSNEPYVEDNVSVRSFSSDETGKWGMVASSLCKARCVK